METSSAETGSSRRTSWFERQRAGDTDTLPLATRELVRIAPRRHLIGPTSDRSRATRAAVRPRAQTMNGERLGQDVADPPAWVE